MAHTELETRKRRTLKKRCRLGDNLTRRGDEQVKSVRKTAEKGDEVGKLWSFNVNAQSGKKGYREEKTANRRQKERCEKDKKMAKCACRKEKNRPVENDKSAERKKRPIFCVKKTWIKKKRNDLTASDQMNSFF